MPRYFMNCKGFEEEEVMEKAAATAGRKRKAGAGESQLATSSVNLKTRRLAVVTQENSTSPADSGNNSTCESDNSNYVLTSCFSSNGSSEVDASEFVDLEAEIEVTGDSLACIERRGMTPFSEVQAESSDLESEPRPRRLNLHRRSTADKMPSEAELEAFFSAAEKNLQKQFIDKYNYDIVKDEPLEGRYEWTQIQPKP